MGSTLALALLLRAGVGMAQVAPAPVSPTGAQAPAGPGTSPEPDATGKGQWVPSPDGGWVLVPRGYELPPVLPYREGRPVPPGYHLEERPIRPAVITGYVVTAVPYFTGLLVTATSGFPNRSAFLLVPWAGPWLTLGLRESRCELETSEDTAADSDGCIEDFLVGMALVFDGIVQAAGGTLLLVGYLATETKLVRDAPAVSLTFKRVGSGYGLSAAGVF